MSMGSIYTSPQLPGPIALCDEICQRDRPELYMRANLRKLTRWDSFEVLEVCLNSSTALSDRGKCGFAAQVNDNSIQSYRGLFCAKQNIFLALSIPCLRTADLEVRNTISGRVWSGKLVVCLGMVCFTAAQLCLMLREHTLYDRTSPRRAGR